MKSQKNWNEKWPRFKNSPWRFSLSRARTNVTGLIIFCWAAGQSHRVKTSRIHCVASCRPVSVLRKTHAVGKTLKGYEKGFEMAHCDLV